MKYAPYDGLEQDKITVVKTLDKLHHIEQSEKIYNNSTNLSELIGNETTLWEQFTESEEEASERLGRTEEIYFSLQTVISRLREHYSPKRGKLENLAKPKITGDQLKDRINRDMYQENLYSLRTIENSRVNLYETGCQDRYNQYGKPPLADELHESEELFESIKQNQITRAQKIYTGFFGACFAQYENNGEALSLKERNHLTQQKIMKGTSLLSKKLLS